MSAELTKENRFRLLAETDRRLDTRFEETDKAIKNLSFKKKALPKEYYTVYIIKELATLFTGPWGQLIEALVKPSALKLFLEQGVNVTETVS